MSDVAQLVHVPRYPPFASVPPHTVSLVPGAHVPPLQQPPLHVFVALHDVPQVWVDVSHAWNAGQSCELKHPHA